MKKLKKGSIEAKRYMAKIRSMRKTKKRKVNGTSSHKDTKSHNVNIRVLSGKIADLTASDFKRVNNDVNGNPRYVFSWFRIADTYADALRLAKKFGGKKFSNKQFGGGIVIQSYNINADAKMINDIVNKNTSIGDYKHNKSQFFEAKKPKNPRKKRTRKQNEWKVSRTKSGRFKKGGITKLNGSIYGIVTGSKYSKLAQQLIIDNIDTYGSYGLKNATELEKIKLLKNTFYSEYGWAVNRMGLQNAVESWLRGLPSIITLPFANYEIIEIAKQWGSLPQNATEKQEDKILNNYWRLMAANIVKLFRKIK